MSRIIRIEATNVKRLKAISIEPHPHFQVIRGNNGEGKTSTLDAIQYTLGGKSTHPPRVIRDGQVRAEVVVETDELIVTRKWDKDGTSLEVTARDGTPMKSPQAVLDKLVGRLSFDPLEFLSLDPKKQLETLKRLVGLDFTELDNKRLRLFTQRTGENKTLSDLDGQLKAVADVEEVAMVDLSALLAEVQQANDALAAVRADDVKRRANENRVMVMERQIKRSQDRIAELTKAIADEEAAILTYIDDLNETKALLEIPPRDAAPFEAKVAELKGQVRDFEQTNVAARAWQSKQQLIDRRAKQQALCDDLTEQLRLIDVEKLETIAACQFPVEGLGLRGDEGVQFNGVPLEQASGAQRLRVSVAIGAALNPKLRVMLVRDGSLLDEKSLALLHDMAVELDAQVFLEMVGNDGEGVVIVDGEVRS